MLNPKELSIENLDKFKRLFKVIKNTLDLRGGKQRSVLVPVKDFQQQGLQPMEVREIIKRVASEKNNLVVIVPHSEPKEPTKEPGSLYYFHEDIYQMTIKIYEHSKKEYEEKYAHNFDIKLRSTNDFQNFYDDVQTAQEKMDEKNSDLPSKDKNITKLEIVDPSPESLKYQVIVNGDYQRPLHVNKLKPSWDTLYRIASEGRVAYEKGRLDYFNTNKDNQIYTKTGCKLTKILRQEKNSMVSNITIELISSKTFATRRNKA